MHGGLVCTCIALLVASLAKGLKVDVNEPYVDPNPLCSTLAYYEDLYLYRVALQYDYSKVPMSDRWELGNYCNIGNGFSNGEYMNEDVISNIVNDRSMTFTSPASLTMNVSGIDCSGSANWKAESNDVIMNTLKGAPNLGVNLKERKIEIKTITTSNEHIQLVWSAILSFNSSSLTATALIKKNDTRGGNSGNGNITNIIDGLYFFYDDTFSPILNTFPLGAPTPQPINTNNTLAVSATQVAYHIPHLQGRPIYMNGAYSNSVVWQTPYEINQ